MNSTESNSRKCKTKEVGLYATAILSYMNILCFKVADFPRLNERTASKDTRDRRVYTCRSFEHTSSCNIISNCMR